jgi:hypothetical protein
VFDYISLFMAFTFAAQGLHWNIFLGCSGVGEAGELCVVHDAHLYLLQFHTDSFGASWWVEMVLFFSVRHGMGRLSIG